jgi:hypothetical protein
MKVTADVKNAQATEKTRGSDVVAEGMMEVLIETDFCIVVKNYQLLLVDFR